MPNIVEYTSKSGITPSDKGINAAQDAARLYGRVGDEIGRDVGGGLRKIGDAVERHQTLVESSEAFKTEAEMQVGILRRYKEESDLPENRANPHFFDSFYTSVVVPAYEAWGNSVTTPGAKELVMRLKTSGLKEIFNRGSADQADIDYTRTLGNHDDGIAAIGMDFENDATEKALSVALGRAATSREILLSSVSDVGKREELRRQFESTDSPRIVVDFYKHRAAAIKLQVSQTGDEAQSPAYAETEDALARQVGFEHLGRMEAPDVTLKSMMDDAVEQGKNLFASKQGTAIKQEDANIQKALLDVDTAMFRDNGAGGVTVAATPEILDAVEQLKNMPGAERHVSQINATLNALHTATQDQITGKERVTNQPTYMTLFDRIGSTTNPLTKEDVDKQRKNLSEDDWQFLRTSAADSKDADPKRNHAMADLNSWLEKIKPGIVKSNTYSGIDSAGAMNFAYFAWKAQDRVKKAIAAGYAPDDVIRILTNPDNHLGLYRDMQPYMTTNKQGLQGVIGATRPEGGGTLPPTPLGPVGVNRPATLPRKPGESTEAYLKRAGR